MIQDAARHLVDLLLSGILPRFPELIFVSVESGIGWIPFMLETCDYHFLRGDVRAQRPEFELLPSDYFRRQVYGCYWFESIAPRLLLDEIGVDRIMFETDFPHPTCSGRSWWRMWSKRPRRAERAGEARHPLGQRGCAVRHRGPTGLTSLGYR